MIKDTNLASKQQVEEFYNAFKEHQKRLGVNIRHRTIFKNLKKNGLKSNSNVLEIGCGIGTVSSLILKYISKGIFVGVDISKESIEFAKKTYTHVKNAEFIVSDMMEFDYSIKFNFIVLPDVLEHIPLEQHQNLFKVISKVSSDDAVVVINIPEPNCLDWARTNHPDKLQIIDQSLSMQDLLNNAYPNNFKLYSMNSYSLQYKEKDYTCVVFKKNMKRSSYTLKGKFILGIENFLSKINL